MRVKMLFRWTERHHESGGNPPPEKPDGIIAITAIDDGGQAHLRRTLIPGGWEASAWPRELVLGFVRADDSGAYTMTAANINEGIYPSVRMEISEGYWDANNEATMALPGLPEDDYIAYLVGVYDA